MFLTVETEEEGTYPRESRVAIGVGVVGNDFPFRHFYITILQYSRPPQHYILVLSTWPML